MKKSYLVVLLCVLFFSVSILSANSGGFKGGLNIANLKGKDAGDTSPRFGGAIGAFIEIPIQNNFSIQSEVMFTMRGATDEYMGVDLTLKLNYIEIPVLAKFMLADQKQGPYVLFGPSLGLNILAELEGEYHGDTDSETIDFASTTDLSLIFGFGVEINEKISLEGRYGLGVNPIYDEDEIEGNCDIQHSGFQILMGIKIN